VIELSHLHAEVHHGAWLVMLAMSSRQINTTATTASIPTMDSVRMEYVYSSQADNI
jgi:hypothetical protein